MNDLTTEQLQAGVLDTRKHIAQVQRFLVPMATALMHRAMVHDNSKMHSPEAEGFAKYGPKLRGMTYDPNNPSSEYEECRRALGVALDHHYMGNSHHPEYYPLWKCPNCEKVFQEEKEFCQNCATVVLREQLEPHISIDGMNLLDIIEMLADWKAAGLRHHGGNLMESIEKNAKRFGLSDQVVSIFKNTAALLNDLEEELKEDGELDAV